MKLIIDIPEEVRNDVLTDGVLYCDYDPILRDAIKNSIVLSECKPEDDIPKIGNIDDFIEFGEKAFGVELTIKKSDSPNTQEPRWIPVSEGLPEEHEWIGTKTFGTTISDEVYVTFENPKGERFTKHLSFQNGKVSNFMQREIDALYKGSVPIAWMSLPIPYEPQESEDNK